jgi:hypothetical protein
MIASAEDNPGISESTLDSTLSPSSIQEIVGEISKSRKKQAFFFQKKWNSLCTRAAPFQRTRTRPVFEYTERELTKKSYSSALQRAVSNSYYSNN